MGCGGGIFGGMKGATVERRTQQPSPALGGPDGSIHGRSGD